jgi:hypothetical protein
MDLETAERHKELWVFHDRVTTWYEMPCSERAYPEEFARLRHYWRSIDEWGRNPWQIIRSLRRNLHRRGNSSLQCKVMVSAFYQPGDEAEEDEEESVKWKVKGVNKEYEEEETYEIEEEEEEKKKKKEQEQKEEVQQEEQQEEEEQEEEEQNEEALDNSDYSDDESDDE